MTDEIDKRTVAEKRLAELNEAWATVHTQIAQEPSATNKLKLQHQADDLAQEIVAIKDQMRQISASDGMNLGTNSTHAVSPNDAATYNITITGGQGFVIGNQPTVTQHFSAASASGTAVSPVNTARLVTLADLIARYFNLADIRDLCFRLGIDYEDVAGAGKSEKVRELIMAVEKNGRLPELIILLKQLRPHVAWE